MQAEKLVSMANQIGAFFASQPGGDAPAAIADHLRKFWEPRMRAQIIAMLHEDGSRLSPAVRKAVESLRA